MKAFVITIMENPESVRVAERCIASGNVYGVKVEKFEAVTPLQNPEIIAKNKGIDIKGFDEIWSRKDRVISAFLSHYALWQKCVILNEPILILEHDAVFKGPIPDIGLYGLVSLGAPSYGRYRTPPLIGYNTLTSKNYLPGAHAYMISPQAAIKLIEKAKTEAQPTDVFINNSRFPWVTEYYPWPIVADDSFTTIQNENGCRAKHNFNEQYKII